MEIVIAVAIVAAWFAGRIREARRNRQALNNAYRIVDEALHQRQESRRAFEVQMDVIRHQRDLLNTFSDATETIWRRDDSEAWKQLRWASHRARTELL